MNVLILFEINSDWLLVAGCWLLGKSIRCAHFVGQSRLGDAGYVADLPDI
jgi:hypothetical protein